MSSDREYLSDLAKVIATVRNYRRERRRWADGLPRSGKRLTLNLVRMLNVSNGEDLSNDVIERYQAAVARDS